MVSICDIINLFPRNSWFSLHYARKDIQVNYLLCTRPMLSKSLMVSVWVSALGCTNIHFIKPGVMVNGQHYQDVLLMQGLLPNICKITEYFIFLQDGIPTHRAQETVQLMQTETPDFISPTYINLPALI